MTISLKPISIFQELEPYDVDVDNRPLLDIQDNLTEIADILNSMGNYLEVAADPSSEPSGGFTPFTCACVYLNNLLIPIDISKPITEIDYSKYSIVLVLSYLSDSKTYACISFSAGIALTNKFNSFVPGSAGRLLRIGPGGELVDQLYYDLAHASKGYQCLYVGKILTPTSIVFGGNQVSVLGNNYYLGKNRNDTTSGLITVQRSNADSNIIFKAININDTGAVSTFAEFVNSSSSPTTIFETNIPVYFSASQLSYNQATGLFLDPNLESKLNEVHFNTPALTSLASATQSYLTAGVNIRSLLDFNSVNSLHSDSYSNSVGELSQNISTKLVFSMRNNLLTGGIDTPIGLVIPFITKSIGVNINALTNQPDNIVPVNEVSGMSFGDYYGTGGAYLGLTLDSSLDPGAVKRPSVATDQATQTVAGAITSNIITDYSDGFTLVLAAKSTTTVPTNIAISADGYLNLSSVKGILTNRAIPILDLELSSKEYVDNQVNAALTADAGKVPLAGTIVGGPNITGSLYIDVAGNIGSNTKVLTLNGINNTEIVSLQPLYFTDSPGGSKQNIYVGTTSGTDISLLSGDEIYQAVNKQWVGLYVAANNVSGLYVNKETVGTNSNYQDVYGEKTFHNVINSVVTNGISCFTLTNSSVSSYPTDISISGTGSLTIDTAREILLTRDTNNTDDRLSVPTKGYVTDLVNNIGPGFDPKSKRDLLSTSLHGVDQNGYYILGDVVHYWCITNTVPYPNNAADGGNSSNPEFNISLPPNLFSMLFTVQAQINDTDVSSGNNDDDMWVQIIGFNPVDSAVNNMIRIKYQAAASTGPSSGINSLIYIVGKVGSLAGL